MERKKPISGEFYRHVDGKLYQVKMLALDSGTHKEKVVYQAMFAPYTCFVMDLEEFMETACGEKDSDRLQEYCFEHVLLEEMPPEGTGQYGESGTEDDPLVRVRAVEEGVSDEELVKALKTGQPERYLEDKITEKEIAHRGLLRLLDAETFHEKRQILIGLRQYMDKHMLNNIAVALDIVLEEGDVDEQFESIMRCIAAFERYEGGRLR